MTNSGHLTKTATRENCSNSLPICESSSVHNLSSQFIVVNSPLVNHSQSESPVDLHLYTLSVNASQPNKICIHRNFLSKCTICNSTYSTLFHSVKLSPTVETPYSGLPSSHLELSNKMAMNSLNPEALLGHDAKHLFGSPSVSGIGIGGNPLAGHLGHISTSIAAGISGSMNPGLNMTGSHLHSSHHHSSHPASLHSMTSSGFGLHNHLAAATTGQRRLSSSTSNTSRLPKSNSNANNKQFLCPMCNKLFTQKGNLKTHMMIHTGDKPYACHVCGKSFTQKGNVDTHIKIHTGVKDYACDSCGKSFTQKGNLKTHVRSVHTKEKPYGCSVCGKSFSQKGNMHTHIRTHNKDDRFPCGLCGKTFSQKGNLKTHMQRHAGTLPKRYGPGGQRRQTTSRLLQVPVTSIGGAQTAAAAAAAAAYAIAAAGNVERSHQTHPNQLNRNTPVSPDGNDDSRSPSSMVHGPSSLNEARHGQQQQQQQQHQQSVISNVQNQQPSREPQVENQSLYHASSDRIFNGNMNSLSHITPNPPNTFSLGTSPSAAAAAAAVLLSSTSGFSKDPKTSHLHLMSSLFH